jgi:hypothetical protein
VPPENYGDEVVVDDGAIDLSLASEYQANPDWCALGHTKLGYHGEDRYATGGRRGLSIRGDNLCLPRRLARRGKLRD